MAFLFGCDGIRENSRKSENASPACRPPGRGPEFPAEPAVEIADVAEAAAAAEKAKLDAEEAARLAAIQAKEDARRQKDRYALRFYIATLQAFQTELPQRKQLRQEAEEQRLARERERQEALERRRRARTPS